MLSSVIGMPLILAVFGLMLFAKIMFLGIFLHFLAFDLKASGYLKLFTDTVNDPNRFLGVVIIITSLLLRFRARPSGDGDDNSNEEGKIGLPGIYDREDPRK